MTRPERPLPTPTHAKSRNGGATNGVGNGKLTPRQKEVLLHCVKAGYYEIPRRRTLRSLAKEMGISAPSLSLILRRAEAKLVHGFARQLEDAPADVLG